MSTRSFPDPSCARRWPVSCGSSPMPPRAAELRLRGQLSRLRSLPLLRGPRLAGELERLQRQLEKILAEPSDEEIWRSVDPARNAERPYTLDHGERLFDDWFVLHGGR